MPNTKSAIKRTKISAKKAEKNTAAKSAMRTSLKKSKIAVNNGDENAKDMVKSTSRVLDKAVAKGIIHKNTAARKKSKLDKALNSAKA